MKNEKIPENIEIDYVFEDTFVDEDFPEKDRSKSYRRKKT